MKFPRHIPAIACLALSSFGNLVGADVIEGTPSEHALEAQEALQKEIDAINTSAKNFFDENYVYHNQTLQLSELLLHIAESQLRNFQQLQTEEPIKSETIDTDILTQAGFCLDEITIYAVPERLKQTWADSSLHVAIMHPKGTILYIDVEAYLELNDEEKLYVLALAKGDHLSQPLTHLLKLYMGHYTWFAQPGEPGQNDRLLKYSKIVRALRSISHTIPFRYASNILENTSLAMRDLTERITFFKTHAPVGPSTDGQELTMHYVYMNLLGNAE